MKPITARFGGKGPALMAECAEYDRLSTAEKRKRHIAFTLAAADNLDPDAPDTLGIRRAADRIRAAEVLTAEGMTEEDVGVAFEAVDVLTR